MDNDILESYFFERNGCNIHYWMAGSEQRPLVIFIHGVGVDHHLFDAQVRDIAQNCRVLVWDLRGHGQSQPKGQIFSVHTAAEDLLALLRYVGHTKAILVGVSIGGNIALMAAALAPESIAGLVLIGTGNQWLKLSLWAWICLRALMLYVYFLPTPLLQKMLSFLASARPEVRSYVYRIWSQMSKQDFVEVWEAFHTIYQRGQRKSQRCMAHPILLVRGRYDMTANYRRQWEWWEYAATHLHSVTIPKAGHLASSDNPTFFNRVLIEYVSQFVK